VSLNGPYASGKDGNVLSYCSTHSGYESEELMAGGWGSYRDFTRLAWFKQENLSWGWAIIKFKDVQNLV